VLDTVIKKKQITCQWLYDIYGIPVYLSTSVFSTNKTDLPRDDWNIVEIDILHQHPYSYVVVNFSNGQVSSDFDFNIFQQEFFINRCNILTWRKIVLGKTNELQC